MNHIIKAIVVVDLHLSEYDNGKLFDENYTNRPGLTIWSYFKKYLNDRFIEIMTLNDFINTKTYEHSIPFYGISYEGYASTIKKFKKYGINLSLIFSGEPSKNAPRFYINFNKRAKNFEYIMAFSGYQIFLKAKKTTFLNFYWPNSFSLIDKYSKNNYTERDFDNLYLLCFVASPKSRVPVNYNKFISRLLSTPRYFLYEAFYFFFPIMQTKDLYAFRLNLVKHLLPIKDFYLFGLGWDVFIKYNKSFHDISIANDIIPINDKFETIKNFRFCLCIENTDFEGYITEKIFEAFYANVIPIYKGTNKIFDYVPQNCFINVDSFASPDLLIDFLNNMTFQDWYKYIININEYLNSVGFSKFNNLSFSETIYKNIIKC